MSQSSHISGPNRSSLGFPLHLLLPPASPRLGSQPSASRPAEQNGGGLRSSHLSPHQGINGVFVLQLETSSLVKFTWNWPIHSETYYASMSDNDSYKVLFRKPKQKEDSKWFNWTCLVWRILGLYLSFWVATHLSHLFLGKKASCWHWVFRSNFS